MKSTRTKQIKADQNKMVSTGSSLLSGFFCAFNPLSPAVPGSNPKHNIFLELIVTTNVIQIEGLLFPGFGQTQVLN